MEVATAMGQRITFWKETEFKNTEIGRIPKEWEVVRLGDIAEKRNEILDPREHNFSIDVFVGLEHILPGDPYLRHWGSPEDVVSAKFRFHKGDILYGKLRPYLDKAALAHINGICSTDILVLIPDSTQVNPIYLVHLLHEQRFIRYATTGMSGTNHPRVSWDFISKYKIPLPPLEEQKAIAHILSTIDKAIELTNKIIEKTERVKQALMNKLLTEGIGHAEFKDTEIGRIPKEWEVVRVREVIREALPGFASGRRDENGIIQLRMDSITTDGRIDPTKYVKVPRFEGVERYLLKPGDVLFNNTNSLDLIGKTALYRGEHKEAVYSNHLTRIRTREEVLLPEWLTFVFLRLWTKRFFSRIAHPHVNQAGINRDSLLSVKIPLPPIEEQKKIAQILLSVDRKLEIERKEKEKLERIKRALMDILLSGRVRVRIV